MPERERAFVCVHKYHINSKSMCSADVGNGFPTKKRCKMAIRSALHTSNNRTDQFIACAWNFIIVVVSLSSIKSLLHWICAWHHHYQHQNYDRTAVNIQLKHNFYTIFFRYLLTAAKKHKNELTSRARFRIGKSLRSWTHYRQTDWLRCGKNIWQFP